MLLYKNFFYILPLSISLSEGSNINFDLRWAMPNSKTSLCIFKNYYFNTLSLENHKFKICFLDADKVMKFIIKWLSCSLSGLYLCGVWHPCVCTDITHVWPKLSAALLDCHQDFLGYTSILRRLKILRSLSHQMMSEPKSSVSAVVYTIQHWGELSLWLVLWFPLKKAHLPN